MRDVRKLVGCNHRIVGVGPFCASPVDRLTSFEVGNTRAEQFDCSRQLSCWRERAGHRSHVFEKALAEFPIYRVDTGGMDTNEDLTNRRLWLWELFQDELFRVAVSVTMDRCIG